MDEGTIFQVLTSGGVIAIITATLTAMFNRRKLGAEATSIITQAASGVVKNLEDDNVRLRAQLTLTDLKVKQYEDESRARDIELQRFARAFDAHLEHDAVVAQALAGAGIAVPSPPPMPTLTRLGPTNP